jgi:hypothetical protein
MIGRFPLSKHELIVSTYQMVILTLFNNINEISFKELREKTKIPDKDLKRNLLTLSIGKNKLLSKKDEKKKEINDDDIFVWNLEFKRFLKKKFFNFFKFF